MNELTMLNFEGKEVRHIMLGAELWWVATDVCDILTIQNVSQALNGLDGDENLLYTLHISGQNRAVKLVNESGLYSLILKSNKPDAKRFRKWITSEVLPSIRKTGQYNVKAITKIDLAKMLIESEEQRIVAESRVKKLESKVKSDKPKLREWEAFLDSNGNCTIGGLAKIIGIKGFGQNSLFKYLRDNRVFHYSNGVNYPNQCYINNGMFILKQHSYRDTSGNEEFKPQILATPKGQKFVYELIMNKYIPAQKLIRG